MLGGSESGTNFLSLTKLEGTLSSLLEEVPGTDIRHEVWTDLTEQSKEMTLALLLGNRKFVLLD